MKNLISFYFEIESFLKLIDSGNLLTISAILVGLLIPLAFFLLEKDEDSPSWDRAVILSEILKVKRLVISIVFMSFPPLFWKLPIKIFLLSVWLVGIYLLFQIMKNSFCWIDFAQNNRKQFFLGFQSKSEKNFRFQKRVDYLKNIKDASDLTSIWSLILLSGESNEFQPLQDNDFLNVYLEQITRKKTNKEFFETNIRILEQFIENQGIEKVYQYKGFPKFSVDIIQYEKDNFSHNNCSTFISFNIAKKFFQQFKNIEQDRNMFKYDYWNHVILPYLENISREQDRQYFLLTFGQDIIDIYARDEYNNVDNILSLEDRFPFNQFHMFSSIPKNWLVTFGPENSPEAKVFLYVFIGMFGKYYEDENDVENGGETIYYRDILYFAQKLFPEIEPILFLKIWWIRLSLIEGMISFDAFDVDGTFRILGMCATFENAGEQIKWWLGLKTDVFNPVIRPSIMLSGNYSESESRKAFFEIQERRDKLQFSQEIKTYKEVRKIFQIDASEITNLIYELKTFETHEDEADGENRQQKNKISETIKILNYLRLIK